MPGFLNWTLKKLEYDWDMTEIWLIYDWDNSKFGIIILIINIINLGG